MTKGQVEHGTMRGRMKNRRQRRRKGKEEEQQGEEPPLQFTYEAKATEAETVRSEKACPTPPSRVVVAPPFA